MPIAIDRRRFFQSGALAAAGIAAGRLQTAAGDSTGGRQTAFEAARQVPVVEEADVVVFGGGPAGVAAAIAAARTGAKTTAASAASGPPGC